MRPTVSEPDDGEEGGDGELHAVQRPPVVERGRRDPQGAAPPCRPLSDPTPPRDSRSRSREDRLFHGLIFISYRH